MIALHTEPRHRSLIAILLASLLLRVALVVRGGQYFFPDETRFDRALEFARLLWTGGVADALKYLAERGDHVGWVALGAIPASVQLLLGRLANRPPEDFAYLSAAMLSLASVGCIYLTYLIARRLGAPAREALLAAFLAACATSLFYWSRHLLPYDGALLLGLTGVWMAVARADGLRRSAWCGLLAGLTFIVYNGYWTLALTVLVLRTVVGALTLPGAMMRALPAGAAFLLAVALPLFISALTGTDALGHMREFSGGVTQGDWGDGFTLPVEYLWHTEHLMALAFAAGTLAACFWAARITPSGPAAFASVRGTVTGDGPWLPGSTALVGSAVALAILGALAIDAALFRVFVVYGRLVRQAVPFLCIATAFAIMWVMSSRPSARWVWAALLSAIATQATWNFARPFREEFPRDLEARLFLFAPMSHALSIDGPELKGSETGDAYTLVNAQFLHPPRGPRPLPPGTTVLAVPHPLSYRPYQYEGFRRHERQILRSTDISIRLVRRDSVAP